MGSKQEKLGQTPLYKAIYSIMASSSGQAHRFTDHKQISCANLGVCTHHHLICQISGLLTFKGKNTTLYLFFYNFNRGGINAMVGSKHEKLGQTPLYKAIESIMTSSSGRAHTFTNRKQISCAKVGVCAHHHVICQIKIP